MKKMLGYQVDEEAAALKMSLSFMLYPTTLIKIAVRFLSYVIAVMFPNRFAVNSTEIRLKECSVWPNNLLFRN